MRINMCSKPQATSLHPKPTFLLLFLLLAAVLLPNLLSAQSVFRLSPSGSDANSGKDDGQGSHPWATISRLNAAIQANSVKGGDSIFFERDGVWRGEVLLDGLSNPSQGLTLQDYGSGEKPLILGTKVVSNWSAAGNGVYTASESMAVHDVFWNGARMTLARYPNSGYLRKDGMPTLYTIEDHDLPSNSDFSGANFRIRSSRWTWETRVVTQTSPLAQGVKFTFNDSLEQHQAIPDNDDWAYYLDNRLDFLDAENEWFQGGSTVTLQTPGALNPGGQTVEVSVYGHGIFSSEEISNLTIRNLAFARQAENGIAVRTSPANQDENSNLSIVACEFFDQGGFGMVVTGTNLDIQDNLVAGSLSGGIRCGYKAGPGQIRVVHNSTVAHNTVRKVGLLPGRGVSGQNGGCGIHFERTSENNEVEYNAVDSTGYAGLSVYLKASRVRFNQVRYSCLELDDGGGIYAFGAASKEMEIAYNYIAHVPGNDATVKTGKAGDFPASGIYMDNKTTRNHIHHNTILDAAKSGVFINFQAAHNRVDSNAVYGCGGEGIMLHSSKDTVTGNLFYGLDADVEAARLIGGNANKWGLRGRYRGNIFGNPYSPYIVAMHSNLFQKVGKRSLVQWQNLIPGQADNSNTLLPFQWTQIENDFYEVDAVTGSELIVNGDFANGGNDWTVTGSGNGNANGGAYTVTGGGLESDAGFALGNAGQTKFYLLQFTVSSTGYGNLEVELLNAGQDEKAYPLSPTARTYSQIIKVEDGYTNAKLSFDIGGSDFTLDDVSLKMVDVEAHDPACKSRLFTNWTAAPQTAQQLLDAEANGCNYAYGWVDLSNQAVDLSAVNIPAYTSTVLVYSGDGTAPPTGADILLIVSDSAAATASELALQGHLDQVMGHSVTRMSDELSQGSDAANYNLVIISGETTPNKIGTKFTSVATPVLLLRPQLLDEMSMASSGGTTTTANTEVEMNATHASHPMAAGLSGTVTISDSAIKFGKVPASNLLTNAIEVSHLPGSTNQVIFGYASSPAGGGAGRRSAFLPNMRDANKLNAQGWALFEGTVCWTLGACSGSAKQALFPTEKAAWKVFPNPTSRSLRVDLGGEAAATVALRMYDLQGHLVQAATQPSQGPVGLDIEALGLPAGMYFLQVQVGQEMQTFRIAYRP